jgi:hypothetical protein
MGHANVRVWRGFYRFWGLTGILVGWNSSSEKRGSLRRGFIAARLGGVLSTVLHYAWYWTFGGGFVVGCGALMDRYFGWAK